MRRYATRQIYSIIFRRKGFLLLRYTDKSRDHNLLKTNPKLFESFLYIFFYSKNPSRYFLKMRLNVLARIGLVRWREKTKTAINKD